MKRMIREKQQKEEAFPKLISVCNKVDQGSKLRKHIFAGTESNCLLMESHIQCIIEEC